MTFVLNFYCKYFGNFFIDFCDDTRSLLKAPDKGLKSRTYALKNYPVGNLPG